MRGSTILSRVLLNIFLNLSLCSTYILLLVILARMYEYAVLFPFLVELDTAIKGVATRCFPQNFEHFVRRALVALALRTDAATHKPSLLFDETFQLSVHSHFLTSYAFTRNPCAFFLRFIGWNFKVFLRNCRRVAGCVPCWRTSICGDCCSQLTSLLQR